MSAIENIREALKSITAETRDTEALEQLMVFLPEDARSTGARGIVVQLVAAQKSWLDYTEHYRKLCDRPYVVEIDEGMTSISSYDSDADDAADYRERAAEFIQHILSVLAQFLGEEPPEDKLNLLDGSTA